MNIKWETPPSASRGPGTVNDEEREFATALQENPGQWARLKDFTDDKNGGAGNLAQTIRKGQRSSFRVTGHGEFQAVSRRIKDTDVTAVYVRFTTLDND